MLPHPISVIAHDIRSAHNVGSVFRTADSAGLEHVYLTGYTATPEHRGVQKTALGAEHAVPWSRHPDLGALLDALQSRDVRVIALERAPAALHMRDMKAEDFPMALLLGNEVSGVAQELIERADAVIALPQYGIKESLNVSVAFGIAAYGLVERYHALATKK